MSSDSRSKVQALHLKRNAYVYIRQSSPRQVLENVESTKLNTTCGSAPLRLAGRSTK
jgi:hypothetical protein